MGGTEQDGRTYLSHPTHCDCETCLRCENELPTPPRAVLVSVRYAAWVAIPDDLPTEYDSADEYAEAYGSAAVAAGYGEVVGADAIQDGDGTEEAYNAEAEA